MAETVICILHNIKKSKSFGRWDTYNVAVTPDRCIFALLTADMLKEAARSANEQGKAAGKDFFSRWGDQFKVTLGYGERYRSMTPDDVLRENPANFSLANPDIKVIKFKQKHSIQDKDSVVRRILGEITFDTNKGKYSFESDGFPEADIADMKQVLGNKIQN